MRADDLRLPATSSTSRTPPRATPRARCWRTSRSASPPATGSAIVGAQRRRQVDAAAADRGRRGARRRAASRASAGCTCAMLGQGDDLDDAHGPRRARRRPGRPRVGGRRALTATCSTACSAASRSRRFPQGLDTLDRAAVAAASGAGSRSPRCCSATPSCCCSTSRPTTSTSRAWTGSRATSPRAAGRSSSSPTIAGSWTPSAPTRGRSPTATVHQYEGGYAAYTLARAERARQAAAREERRQQLIRKELAWLRRGPPARTSKPKFRIEAANALIADEPEPRDRAELLRFATTRLGNKVIDAEHVSLAYGDQPHPARCHLAARARATASRWSASTARARRR